MPADRSGGPRDLHEAVAAVLLAADHGHPIESLRLMAEVRQHYALASPIPGEAEDSAMFRITANVFDDVARHTESAEPGLRVARFRDLDDDAQKRFIGGLRGVYVQMGLVARKVVDQ